MSAAHDPPLPSRETAPPPLSPALAGAIATMRPVRTRAPWRAVALTATLAALIPLTVIFRGGLRQDFLALPRVWVAAMAIAWTVGLFATLTAATWPRRGAVLPDAAKAGRTAAVVAVVLMLLGLFATVDAPGMTHVPDPTMADFLSGWWHCVRFSLVATFPLLIVGGLTLRRLFPVGGTRIAAALGAAGGAMAGLTLHFICPIGGGLHVGLAHAGGVVLGALLGMLLLPRVVRS